MQHDPQSPNERPPIPGVPDMPDRSLEYAAYIDVARGDVGRLAAFRERAIRRYHEWRGAMVPYWTLEPDAPETPERAIVFLPGANGHGAIWFPYMLELARRHRCIAVSIPACGSMSEYGEFLEEVLDACGVDRVLYAGTSVGGCAAQVFARAHPERTDGMALCLTGTASAELPPELRSRWIARRRRALRLRFQPFGEMVRSSMARQAFAAFCPDKHYDTMIFWREYLVEVYRNYVYKKQNIAINTRMMPGYYAGYAHRPDDLADWPGRVLIIESSDDPLFAEGERAALRALYPGARVVTLPEGGQFGLYLHEREAARALEAWADGT